MDVKADHGTSEYSVQIGLAPRQMVETPQLGFLLVCTQYILPAAGCSLAPARPPGWSWCPRPGGIVHDRQVITCQLKDVSSIAVSRWTRHYPRPGGIVHIQQAGDHLSTLHLGTCHPCSCCCHSHLLARAVTATCRGGPIVRTYSITCLLLGN